jgi:hypothetical protein
MTEIFKLNLDLKRSIPFILDALIEIGVGVVILFSKPTEMTIQYIGIGLITVGIVQFVRKLKTFHLSQSELTIKRPLFPFKIAESTFTLDKIQKIKFNNIKGRFGGPHLNVISKERNGDFRIEAKTEKIDEFENELNKLGIVTERIGM